MKITITTKITEYQNRLNFLYTLIPSSSPLASASLPGVPTSTPSVTTPTPTPNSSHNPSNLPLEQRFSNEYDKILFDRYNNLKQTTVASGPLNAEDLAGRFQQLSGRAPISQQDTRSAVDQMIYDEKHRTKEEEIDLIIQRAKDEVTLGVTDQDIAALEAEIEMENEFGSDSSSSSGSEKTRKPKKQNKKKKSKKKKKSTTTKRTKKPKRAKPPTILPDANTVSSSLSETTTSTASPDPDIQAEVHQLRLLMQKQGKSEFEKEMAREEALFFQAKKQKKKQRKALWKKEKANKADDDW
eukprot:TRINITY_DN17763_c0_g1_i1.p1 TRINITY_DN17763_c0_g1~~TRINITY_DN17763_c0_g1_i1.p1  ORF type:complete len:327 (+),score=75.69 TRINITY_DN17763_c0_g1_i1:89-982(+)